MFLIPTMSWKNSNLPRFVGKDANFIDVIVGHPQFSHEVYLDARRLKFWNNIHITNPEQCVIGFQSSCQEMGWWNVMVRLNEVICKTSQKVTRDSWLISADLTDSQKISYF